MSVLTLDTGQAASAMCRLAPRSSVGCGAFRVFYGLQDRPGSTISGLRGVRVGGKPGCVVGGARRQSAGRGASPSVRPTIMRAKSSPAAARWALLPAVRRVGFAGVRSAGLSHSYCG